MLKNEPYSTALMTDAETNSPIVISPVSEATVEGFAAAVMIGDLTSNRNLRQLLQDTGLVYPVNDWSNYPTLNTHCVSGIGQPV